MKDILVLGGSGEVKFRDISDEAEWLTCNIHINQSESEDREMMAQCFENGIRTVERCQVIKAKAGRKYKQNPEHGRGKGKRTKQWDVR